MVSAVVVLGVSAVIVDDVVVIVVIFAFSVSVIIYALRSTDNLRPFPRLPPKQ
jgi:hypothetical protein